MKTRNIEENLSLVNNGTLSFFFIGTGSAFSKSYFQTNLLIIKGNDHILIDCGTLCPYVIDTKYNLKIKNIENLLVTHPHADHIGGLEEMAFLSYYTKNSRVNIVITDEFKKKLWNESLRGGMQFSENGKMSFDDYFNQMKPVKIRNKPFPMHEINIGSINLKLFRTHHVTTKKDSFRNSQYSVGLIVDDRILFTADTQFRPEQINWITQNFNIEYIFHDCDVSGFSAGVHATYQELKTLPVELKSKMYLCHYSSKVTGLDVIKDGFAGLAKAGLYYDFD